MQDCNSLHTSVKKSKTEVREFYLVVAGWKMQPAETEEQQECTDKGDLAFDSLLLNKSAMKNGKSAVQLITPVF
jgi:hypothetical protein